MKYFFHMKNKTKEDIKQIIMSYALPGNLLEDVKGTELAELVDTLSENFVAKGEVRERVSKYIEKNDFRIMRKLTLGSLEQLYEGENTEENFINGLLKSLE